MTRLTARDVARICGGRVLGDADATADGLGPDSRELAAGQAFVAVRGGHAFVAEAVSRGASFVLVHEQASVPDGATAVVVTDTVDALAALAAERRGRLDVPVVAITGSTGKTLTKDLTAAALGVRFRVHAAPASYNTEVTVPLVVLSCPDDAEVLVTELGARHAGDIASLASLVRPSVGVITGIGVAHLGEFGSRAAIAATKAELLAALPADGTAIVPSTDDFLPVLAGSTDATVVTVGPGGRVRHEVRALGPDGRADVRVRGDGFDVRVVPPLPGRSFAVNAALAVAVAVRLGVDARDAADAIGRAPTSPWRMQVQDAGALRVVNDAYNANPTSMAGALRTVAEVAAGRELWAVLGPMAELGPATDDAHVRAGRLAAGLGYRVVAVGPDAAAIARGAGAGAIHVGAVEDAVAVVRSQAPEGAVVLVKASRAAGLERVAEALAAQAVGTGDA